MNHTRNFNRWKRGQATVIGAVLFLIVIVLMVGFINELYQTQTNMNQIDIERFQEHILITSAYIDSNQHLVLNVTNQGAYTANLVRLWIINQTHNEPRDFPFSNLILAPGASITNVTSLQLDLNMNYAIRVVTERGNIASYNLVPQVQARVSVYAPSSTAKIGENVTVYLGITNNDTSGNNIYNLVPTLNVNPNGSLTLLNGPSPSNITLLPNGETAYFRYVYNVTGSGAPISVNGSFTNAPAGCFDTCTLFANLVPQVRARISIYAPSSTQIGENVTVYLGITNNDTSGNNIYNLVPTLNVSPASSLTLLETVSPSRVTLLPNGETAYFRYVYKVTGSGLAISLNGSFTNAPAGNYDNCTIFATTGAATIDLSIMPIWRLDSIGSIPALIEAKAGSVSYWGIALVNPYNRSITVFSVAAIATSVPIFKGDGSSGTLIGINPTTGTWSQTAGSVYSACFWESTAGQPIIIPPHSVYNFTFTVEAQNAVIETPVYVEAISTEGKFSRVFTTSVDAKFPSMNLYYTRTPSSPLTDRQYAFSGLKANTTYTFNVTVHNSSIDKDLTSSYNLLLLCPVGWRNFTIWAQSDWGTSSISHEGDGSTIVSVMSAASSMAPLGVVVYQFNVTTPEVSSTTLYRLGSTLYYPTFSPSITAAYCDLAIQIVP